MYSIRHSFRALTNGAVFVRFAMILSIIGAIFCTTVPAANAALPDALTDAQLDALGFAIPTTRLSDFNDGLNRLPSDIASCVIKHVEDKGIKTLYSTKLTAQQRAMAITNFNVSVASCADHQVQVHPRMELDSDGKQSLIWDVWYWLWT